MNAKATNKGGTNPPLWPAGEWEGLESLQRAARGLAEDYAIGFVLVSGNPHFSGFVGACPDKPWAGGGFPNRFVLLWHADKIDPLAILSWRNGLVEDFKHAQGADKEYRFVPVTANTDESFLKQRLADWVMAPPGREPAGLVVGAYVQLPADKPIDSDHPGFLTISPQGALSGVLDRLDECRRLYAHLIGPRVDERRRQVHALLDPLLARPVGGGDEASAIGKLLTTLRKQFPVDPARIPRVLLLGPSGCGKSLIARYLAWRISAGGGEPPSRPFKRLPIPEYLGREDQLEYDLFGFRGGAYTQAPDTGSRGVLLERLGGVIFLDEIGDASPSLQAKLLAYLDDYLVTPRGWVGEPLFCPMLVVAATNRPIDQWAREDARAGAPHALFRNDLLRRFNVMLRLPGLNERKDELPFILDALLQTPGINPEGRIRQVGADALQRLRGIDYDAANFRLLEGLLRAACARARRAGRDYVVAGDVDAADERV